MYIVSDENEKSLIIIIINYYYYYYYHYYFIFIFIIIIIIIAFLPISLRQKSATLKNFYRKVAHVFLREKAAHKMLVETNTRTSKEIGVEQNLFQS